MLQLVIDACDVFLGDFVVAKLEVGNTLIHTVTTTEPVFLGAWFANGLSVDESVYIPSSSFTATSSPLPIGTVTANS